MEEDIEYRIKRFLDECEDGNWYWDDGVDAIETLIKGYKELEDRYLKNRQKTIKLESKIKRYEKYLENKDKKFEEALEYEYQEREIDYIPKSKFREKMEELDNMIKEINKRKTSKVHSRRDYSFKEIFTRTYGGRIK